VTVSTSPVRRVRVVTASISPVRRVRAVTASTSPVHRVRAVPISPVLRDRAAPISPVRRDRAVRATGPGVSVPGRLRVHLHRALTVAVWRRLRKPV
jgi:hypothetical protein